MNASVLFLPCAAGVEEFLLDEVREILGGAGHPLAQRGGVEVRGGADAVQRLNLHSRLAQRVLWRVTQARVRDEKELYELARQVRWQEWITPQQTLRVDTTAHRSPMRSLNYANLLIKDAVCDALRDLTGERPSVDTHAPDLPLLLHLHEEQASIYVDTSGESLFKRGWREQQGEAPLKETLAAAMLAAAGWSGRGEDGPLLDPCCGAGTIVIEAAQRACRVAPGMRRRFAFERLAPFRDHTQAWAQLREAARAQERPSPAPIFAGDVAFRMTDFAQRNAERAGVAQAIEFKTVDAMQRTAPAPAGTLMMNPPYGERLAPKGRGNLRESFEGGGTSAEFFSALASHWKHGYAGWTAWILSPDMKLPSLMRLKESRRVPLWNGPIECRLFRFELVAGSAR